MHLFGFIIRIYHYARSPERQNLKHDMQYYLTLGQCIVLPFPIINIERLQPNYPLWNVRYSWSS